MSFIIWAVSSIQPKPATLSLLSIMSDLDLVKAGQVYDVDGTPAAAISVHQVPGGCGHGHTIFYGYFCHTGQKENWSKEITDKVPMPHRPDLQMVTTPSGTVEIHPITGVIEESADTKADGATNTDAPTPPKRIHNDDYVDFASCHDGDGNLDLRMMRSNLKSAGDSNHSDYESDYLVELAREQHPDLYGSRN